MGKKEFFQEDENIRSEDAILRERLLDEDGISAEEEAFMRGFEKAA